MHPLLNIAIKAARRAGQIISRASLDVGLLKVSVKQQSDFVTDVDRAAEAAIIELLLGSYPQHAILAEESGMRGDSEYQWIIDPLDGTTNFIHGLPQYAVSIALAHRGVLQHGVVFDVARNELFTASRGSGAYLNDRRIRVSRRTRLGEALIGTGFPFREFAQVDRYLAILRELMHKSAGLRRPGSAAIDLAWLAAGRTDGFFEFGLAPWDMAAGALLVSEAGGIITDCNGEGDYLTSGHVVAGSPKIFTQLLQVVRTAPEGTPTRPVPEDSPNSAA